MEEPQENAARPDSEHYREMARKLRELAREFRFPGAQQELLDLASRYERRADRLDARAPAGSDQDQRYDGCERALWTDQPQSTQGRTPRPPPTSRWRQQVIERVENAREELREGS